MGLNVQNKLNLTYEKVAITDVFKCFKFAFASYKARFFLHLLTTALLFVWLLLIPALSIISESFIFLLICFTLSAYIMPLNMACLVVTNEIYQKNISGCNYFKYIFSRLWQSESFKLIFIYVLIGVAISLASYFLTISVPELSRIIDIITKIAMTLLFMISWIAIPTNLRSNGKIQPFHLLWYSLIAVMKNFIPIVLFVVLNVIILLLILVVGYLATEFLHVWGYAVLIVGILLFVAWIGVMCSYLANSVLSIAD